MRSVAMTSQGMHGLSMSLPADPTGRMPDGDSTLADLCMPSKLDQHEGCKPTHGGSTTMFDGLTWQMASPTDAGKPWSVL